MDFSESFKGIVFRGGWLEVFGRRWLLIFGIEIGFCDGAEVSENIGQRLTSKPLILLIGKE